MNLSTILRTAINVVEKVIVMIVDLIRDELENKDREEITQNLKSKMGKAFENHKKKMEALPEYFQEKKESTQNRVQNLIKQLEKNKEMKKEKERAQALQSRLKRKVLHFFKRIHTLKEDVQKWPETIMLELRVQRGALKNIKGMEEKDIIFALENMLEKNLQEFSQNIETLKEDVEKCMEFIKSELQVLEDELEEKKQGKKEEEIELDQKKLLKKNMRQFSQKIETLKEDVAGSVETINLKLRNLINELEEEGQGMKKEKELAWFLESRLKRKVQHFSRRIQTLKEDVEELPEIIMLELQVRRRVLKNMKGKKENDIASALETLKKKNMREFSQKIETLKEDAEECMATINHELQILINELEEEGQGKEQSWECCTETEVEELSARIQAMLLWKTASL